MTHETTLETKIIQTLQQYALDLGTTAYLDNPKVQREAASAIKKLIVEGRCEEWTIVHETLHAATITAELHVQSVMNDRLAELRAQKEEERGNR